MDEKITQSLDKKNQPTSRDKKNMQPLGTKKITQPLGTKKTQPLETNKITQPLRSKKSRNLLGQKILQTKITLSIGPIASKVVNKALNCFKWHQICPNRSKLVRIGLNGSKLVNTFQKGTK